MEFTGEQVVIGSMKGYIPTLQEHIARYNFALRAAEGNRVLDAACGTGYGTKLLSESASEVIGVDISNEAITYASKLYPDIAFSCIDLSKTFPADGPYDLIVSFETIEHLDKPEVFLKNASQNCKEFLFSIPVNNPNNFHKHVWSKEEIIKLINKYWSRVDWYHQEMFNFYAGADDATFLIGSAYTLL